MSNLHFSVVVISIHVLLSAGNSDTKEILHVLVQLPYPIPNSNGLLPSWNDGPNIIPAMNLAARQINNRTDLLPNYNLELEHINGGCDYIDVTVTNLAESVASLLESKNRRFVGLIGPGCSGATFGIAPLTNRSDLSMITIHGAGASVFSNRESHPYYFGSLGSNEGYGELAVALMRKTGWRRIALLFHEVRLYYNTLKMEVEGAVAREFSDAEIVFSSMVRLNNFYPLNELQRSRARIIFVVTPPEHSRQIMCLAFHLGMIYPAYQWVLSVEVTTAEFMASVANNISFTYDDRQYECTVDNFKSALNNSFFMNYRLIPFNQSVESVAGLNYTEYYKLYQQEVEQYNKNDSNPFANVTTTVWAAYFYDSLWALAIALHNVTEKHHLNLSEYRYKDENITQLIAEELYNVDFNGNSGPISFSRQTGFLVREIDLTQTINFTEVFTAYSNAGQIVKVRSFDFIDDKFDIRNQPARLAVAALYGLITLVQLLVVITLHVLMVVYREHKSVKASSPKLNHIAFVGVYVLVVGILLNVINEIPSLSHQVRGGLCQGLWAWCLPISFTLALGPVVVRTWRLYRIFTHYLDPGPFISNPVLITIVFIMFTADLIIAIVWTTIDPFRLDELESTVRDEGANFLTIRLGCRNQYYFIWLGGIMAFKLTILTVLIVLVFLTRHIKNQSFATTSLRVFGYLFAIIFVLGFSLYYIFALGASFDPNLELSALCIMLNLLLLSITVCIFLPPLLPPLREKIQDYRAERYQVRKTRDKKKMRKVSAQSADSQSDML